MVHDTLVEVPSTAGTISIDDVAVTFVLLSFFNDVASGDCARDGGVGTGREEGES